MTSPVCSAWGLWPAPSMITSQSEPAGAVAVRAAAPRHNGRRPSRGERHADVDSTCFAKCSANRLTASHSV